jgi:hypothetical protein
MLNQPCLVLLPRLCASCGLDSMYNSFSCIQCVFIILMYMNDRMHGGLSSADADGQVGVQ